MQLEVEVGGGGGGGGGAMILGFCKRVGLIQVVGSTQK